MTIIKRCLISVSDKTGIVAFARGISDLGIEVLSTGGTSLLLKEAGIAVSEVEDVTGFPEILDGRVKTLHPAIHGGLLARRDVSDHQEALQKHGISPIDLLVVSLYPFEQALEEARPFAEMVEKIDIGGPSMIRSAAKNHAHVVVLVDPKDYPVVLDLIKQGEVSQNQRRALAQKAFARTAAYDSMISLWLSQQEGEAELGSYFAIGGAKKKDVRYGENPHQKAALYATAEQRAGVASARQVQGKDLSYNNLNDTDAAFECVCEFSPQESSACVIVKHANPCGAALGETAAQAYEKAFACDPTSAFGGIVAFNCEIDEKAAARVLDIFTEVVIAPQATPEAQALFAQKKNLRLLLTGGLASPRAVFWNVKTIAGGLLVQSRDTAEIKEEVLSIVTKRAPYPQELRDLLFAMKIAKHVKSNGVVYAREQMTVGIGAGQMSRLDSCEIATQKFQALCDRKGINRKLASCVVASDAFFPFADGVRAALKAGATAIIQPGGSIRDQEVIEEADSSDMAMVFTGIRHFRH